MKCIILAAGYATRLYPLTENFPKPLLKVGDKTILDWLLDDISSLDVVDEYILVSNHKFVNHFTEWSKARHEIIIIIDDGTTSNETRLGAVRDMELAVKQNNIKDDVLVIAGDNLLDFSLGSFIEYAKEKQTTCLMRYFEPNISKLQRCGVIEIDSTDKVLNMEEKPENPKSNWCVPPFYVISKDDLVFLSRTRQVDSPGRFFVELSSNSNMNAMMMLGKRYDIGNIENYEYIIRTYRGIEIRNR